MRKMFPKESGISDNGDLKITQVSTEISKRKRDLFLNLAPIISGIYVCSEVPTQFSRGFYSMERTVYLYNLILFM